MKICTLSILFIFIFYAASPAQDRKVKVSPDRAADSIISDHFSSDVQQKNGHVSTNLTLNHCRFCDEGTFSYLHRYPHSNVLPMLRGTWTVLKGDAKDENATVVELDGEKNARPMYYLRLKNGDLQELDSLLREVKPVKGHILKKQ